MYGSLISLLRAHIDGQARALGQAVTGAIHNIPERPMRTAVLAERLSRLDAHGCFAVLHTLQVDAAARRGFAKEVLLDLCLSRPLESLLGPQRSAAIFRLARGRGDRSVPRLFLGIDARGDEADPAIERRLLGGEVAENQKLPDESLGRRKAMARGRDRFALDRLVHDRNPAVLRNLLDNPLCTERDVVRIAAMRPTSSACVEVVFRHPRWIARHRVKVAIASNPWTPPDLAIAILPHLLRPELRWIATHAGMAEPVREEARTLLAPRRTLPSRHDEARPRGTTDAAGDEEVDLDALQAALCNWRAHR